MSLLDRKVASPLVCKSSLPFHSKVYLNHSLGSKMHVSLCCLEKFATKAWWISIHIPAPYMNIVAPFTKLIKMDLPLNPKMQRWLNAYVWCTGQVAFFPLRVAGSEKKGKALASQSVLISILSYFRQRRAVKDARYWSQSARFTPSSCRRPTTLACHLRFRCQHCHAVG